MKIDGENLLVIREPLMMDALETGAAPVRKAVCYPLIGQWCAPLLGSCPG